MSIPLVLNIGGITRDILGVLTLTRVLPVLKEAIDSEKINLISIINTHQYVPKV